MRDEMSVVEPVRRYLCEVRWLEAAEIRARARRRSRRTALVVGLVLVGTLSATTIAMFGRPWNYPPAVEDPAVSASVSPAGQVASMRSDVPRDALVQQSDLAVRTELQLDEPAPGGTVDLGPGLDRCGAGTATQAWASRSQTLLSRSPDSVDQLGDILVVQDLYRFRDDGARRLFEQVRQAILACPQWGEVRTADHNGSPVLVETTRRWDTPRVDFAGDESLLLRHSVSSVHDHVNGDVHRVTNSPDLRVVLRVGDLVTVLRMADEAKLVRLADVAARRMCVAANPRC
ncbi:hypothetical protein [Salinispora arenicola]|uniref:hypothetical protein n=1 Tax=Salinispora arenicola TaxID=168697 RepID=UPI00037A84AB|nr:hypothetical protein [Salinispora arenicola]